MPRPKVDRVMRSMRLRAEVDARLVAKAKREGLSINQAVEQAVMLWTATTATKKPSRSRQVQPRFKKS
jgi:predicted HicB family RNase H-like nuclease